MYTIESGARIAGNAPDECIAISLEIRSRVPRTLSNNDPVEDGRLLMAPLTFDRRTSHVDIKDSRRAPLQALSRGRLRRAGDRGRTGEWPGLHQPGPALFLLERRRSTRR